MNRSGPLVSIQSKKGGHDTSLKGCRESVALDSGSKRLTWPALDIEMEGSRNLCLKYQNSLHHFSSVISVSRGGDVSERG